MKLFIVSNRLPVKTKKTEQENYEFERSEGGLATGLSSLDSGYDIHWIGWPGINTKRKEEERTIKKALNDMGYHPVFLSVHQYNNYYEGYSNSTLWPLCHYFYSYVQQKRKYWEAYQDVNRLFCDKVLEVVGDEGMVWVQDYQLMLLPKMLREKRPHLKIGYFHHIPFPSYELFRVLPERSKLLEGLLGADLIAFHTHDYMRHFISTTERTIHKEFKLNEVMIQGRAVHVEALPMGINYELYQKSSQNKTVKQNIVKIQKKISGRRIVLSVDRLDYSKGILHRLVGFESFLDKHSEYQGKVTLVMIVVPSRDKVEKYAEMKRKIDERISIINGRYAKLGWTPVEYFYHGFPFEELAAMYCEADVALVSPLRDGMNLVAKEYIATKQKNNGVLILSEMAGAAAELKEAILINPNDTEQIATAIYQALSMSEEDRNSRMNRMKMKVAQQNVNKWAKDFIEEWDSVIKRNELLDGKCLSVAKMNEVSNFYRKSHKRLIVLDYDGTLAEFKTKPMNAAPTPEVLHLLRKLCEDKANRVVVNSGRDKENLEAWFGDIEELSLAAEHGACYKEYGTWHGNVNRMAWDEHVVKTMQNFVRKTPGAWLEEKNMALAWHYRDVDAWTGLLRSKQLMQALFPSCSALNLQILNGNKVVEVKPNSFSKGTEVQRLLNSDVYDFILAIGDDATDEIMFQVMPKESITIKVGGVSDDAQYCVRNQKEVVPLLEQLVK